MRTLAMFPGQGSQYVGMGKQLLSEFSYVSEVFEEAEDHTGLHLRKICFEDAGSELNLTPLTQPCILTVSMAYWRVLVEESGVRADVFAGHSLGEYSALVAAGRLDFASAVKLVRLRGLAMQDAVPLGEGAMAAVMNLPEQDLTRLCEIISQPGSEVNIANYNSDKQLVVAGHTAAVDRLIEVSKEHKARAVKLPVSAPFHSPMMTSAKENMTPHLEQTPLLQMDNWIIPNVSGRLEQTYQQQLLIDQIDSPVYWTQSIRAADQHGITRYVEVGPGKVLSGLIKRISVQNDHDVISSDNVKEAISLLSE